MYTENQKRLIDSLSEEIQHQAWQCAAEQHAPRYDADQMDKYIEERQANVKQLRQIREQLEDLFTGRLN